MKILISGVSGFVGKHLAREVRNRGFEPIGIGYEKLEDTELKSLLANYAQCDLTSKQEVLKLNLQNIDAVISLAGLASVGASFAVPEKYMSLNVSVLTNLLDELTLQGLTPRIVAISSGAVYAPNQPMPLTEGSTTSKDTSPYAASKIAMEQALQPYRDKGLDCIVVRPFNHIGPGQNLGFLLPDLHQKILAADENNGKIYVGNLATKRDYTDVRDIVRAYVDLATTKSLNYKIYNACSGESRSGEEVLNELLSVMEIIGKIHVQMDENLIRPGDSKDLYGDYSRLKHDIGWAPKIAFRQTIEDFVRVQR